MDKLSRKELLDYIERQDEKNAEYRRRFKDLVAAYRGLLNEKAALQSSLEALSNKTGKNVTSTGALDTSESADHENISVTESKSDKPVVEDSSTEDRIEALSKALVTLTQEKSRNESSLLADKKKLMQELDDLKVECEENKHKFEQERSTFQKAIQELRADISREKQQRHEDQNQQALKMRELQAKLITERAIKEKFEQQYEALVLQQKMWKPVGSSHQRSAEEYEKMLEDLTKEVAKLKKLHQETLEKSRKPNPVLLKLQSEMEDIKVKHQEAVADEQRQSCHAKAELRSLAFSSETRITSLEAKVAELSQMIGNYDRIRTQDQSSIQKLKERIAQLDLEKNHLLQQQMSKSRSTSCDENDQEDSNLDVHALAEKITKMKDLLYLANQRSEKPLDAHVLLRLQESPVSDGDIHSRCKDELQQLKDEFEHYKSRAQTVLRSKATKNQENHGEMDSLRRQVSDLKVRLHTSRAQSDQQIKAFDEKLQNVQHEHRQQMKQLRSQLESDHSTKIVEMEQQIQKQRERTVALLEEKEQELAHKEGQLASLKIGSTFPAVEDRHHSQASDSDGAEETPSNIIHPENLPEMLTRAMNSSSGDHLILHYVQDIARKDVEIGNLRRFKHQAETELRELRRESQVKEERYKDDLETLQAKIYRLESSQSEEGMNMEYLKNVVLRYILCKDIEGKRRILNAIAAVLHFTVRELEMARMGL